jgi:hypothetical protein
MFMGSTIFVLVCTFLEQYLDCSFHNTNRHHLHGHIETTRMKRDKVFEIRQSRQARHNQNKIRIHQVL